MCDSDILHFRFGTVPAGQWVNHGAASHDRQIHTSIGRRGSDIVDVLGVKLVIAVREEGGDEGTTRRLWQAARERRHLAHVDAAVSLLPWHERLGAQMARLVPRRVSTRKVQGPDRRVLAR